MSSKAQNGLYFSSHIGSPLNHEFHHLRYKDQRDCEASRVILHSYVLFERLLPFHSYFSVDDTLPSTMFLGPKYPVCLFPTSRTLPGYVWTWIRRSRVSVVTVAGGVIFKRILDKECARSVENMFFLVSSTLLRKRQIYRKLPCMNNLVGPSYATLCT